MATIQDVKKKIDTKFKTLKMEILETMIEINEEEIEQ